MSLPLESIPKSNVIDFKKYHKENPHIWKAFKKFARQAKYEKGFKHYSSYGIFEIMRWHTGITGTGEFKINNNFRPDYARKMMKKYPEFRGFFRTRKLEAPRT